MALHLSDPLDFWHLGEHHNIRPDDAQRQRKRPTLVVCRRNKLDRDVALSGLQDNGDRIGSNG